MDAAGGAVRRRRLDQVVRVTAAEALREHVLHAGRFQHRAHARAGDHAGAGRRRLQQHLAGAEVADDLMGDRAAAGDRDWNMPFFAASPALRIASATFVRLAETDADAALLVADRDDRVEPRTAGRPSDLGRSGSR